jgi:hypothetical protein
MSPKRALKPALVLLLVAVVASTAAFGQTRTHDLSLSFGVLSIDQMADVLQDVLTVVLSFGSFGKSDASYTGVPFLTYHYSANSRFGFGGAIGTYSSKGTLQVLGEDAGTYKERNYIAAAELDYRWIMREGFQLYSGAGFGVRYRHGAYQTEGTETLNRVLPTFHINALGVRVGKRIAFFAELGAGYKGVLLAGINGQF